MTSVFLYFYNKFKLDIYKLLIKKESQYMQLIKKPLSKSMIGQ